jgi:hypothetical protein
MALPPLSPRDLAKFFENKNKKTQKRKIKLKR